MASPARRVRKSTLPDAMTETSRRPILHLKLGTVVKPMGPAAAPPPAPRPAAFKPARPPAPPPATWKCRPCGSGFTPPEVAAETDAVRCPSCNAKLGLVRDFRGDPPNLDRLRARPVKR